jgi:hypothetical protein
MPTDINGKKIRHKTSVGALWTGRVYPCWMVLLNRQGINSAKYLNWYENANRAEDNEVKQ